ncbi:MULTISPECIES: alanine/ornithine racemase family PLP-dependent enzyme [Vibrio]|uniref:Alanine/ornithine racemase family PLP-dependent enzyme n=1 Tax=Vibrio cortegadensis TaxID=1328770 RepID=A0ABV4M2D1_9VIBR|nr:MULTISPECIES: alanine/ornithine racemase family PLP-dependent enzyme [Vibrio]MDN3698508.1 alanine/ornithine racemase family PLP-dependent enzyme [Vibrio cortegadensis]NOH83160.1 alanine/ornithine racemase family PLP-dependent enzyme [Vibrio sp. 03-59-1]
MSDYPCINIHLDTITQNAKNLVSASKKYGVFPTGVTKLACAYPQVGQAILNGGIRILADSRVQNLKKLRHLQAETMLLRIPAISDVSDVVRYADISLNSELETLQALSVEAIKQQRIHQVILMHDMGDLREGAFYQEETLALARQVMTLEGLKLVGLGTNLACYGGVEPSVDNQKQLIALAQQIEQEHQIHLMYLSGASSAGLPLMLSGSLPQGINQLRLGASILMGIGLNDDPIPNTRQDTFDLSAEVVEIKVKPSVPTLSTALDAFGQRPEFIDRGLRKRAICAIGKQDIDIDQMTPKDSNIIVIGGSSDHLILDITDCDDNYHIGSLIDFELSYGGVLQCMTSEYITKHFI